MKILKFSKIRPPSCSSSVYSLQFEWASFHTYLRRCELRLLVTIAYVTICHVEDMQQYDATKEQTICFQVLE
jgi:hypothetical protein